MANDERMPEMQQQFNELRRAIADDAAHQLAASERRLREGFSRDFETRQEARAGRDQLARDFDARLETRVTGLSEKLSVDMAAGFAAGETRLREGLSAEMATRFDASERRLTQTLSQVVARQLETAQQHLEGRLQVHAEDLKGLVTKAAEGYGATLETIDRKLGALNRKVDVGFADHGKVLADHSRRIVRLEHGRRRRSG